MGHSQFAETIGARGPNTQVNCGLRQHHAGLRHRQRLDPHRPLPARRGGRRRRRHQRQPAAWFGAGFLASGAAATDERGGGRRAPLRPPPPRPADRHGRRGRGAGNRRRRRASAACAPICEVLGTVTANSAFHGSRLDVDHIAQVMEKLVAGAEARWGLDRRNAWRREMVFVSHETYTPARGGSAQAEVDALRRVFGAAADTDRGRQHQGLHRPPHGGRDRGRGGRQGAGDRPRAAGAELQGVDPELGTLNLSRGGAYPSGTRCASAPASARRSA